MRQLLLAQGSVASFLPEALMGWASQCLGLACLVLYCKGSLAVTGTTTHDRDIIHEVDSERGSFDLANLQVSSDDALDLAGTPTT